MTELQALLGQFTNIYNHQRPHRSLPRRQAPAAAYAARPKAAPGNRDADTHDRVRTGKIWAVGTVTLRHAGKLHHIGAGRAHAGTEVLILTQDLHIRIINKATGELLRELTLNPSRDYQPTGRPPGRKPSESPRRVRRLGLLLAGLGQAGVLTVVDGFEFGGRNVPAALV
jgi:hypothetical protein